MNCIVCVWEGNKGVSVWFGTPGMQRMYGLSLAWHRQFVCGHVHDERYASMQS